MENEYKKLLMNLKDANPSDELFEKIILRIGREERMQIAKKRVLFFSVFFIASFFGFIYSFIAVQAAFINSGFMEFFSLLFSDFGVVVACWQNFALTLLESLPVLALVVTLLMFSLVLGLFTFLMKDIKFINSNNIIIGKKHGF